MESEIIGLMDHVDQINQLFCLMNGLDFKERTYSRSALQDWTVELVQALKRPQIRINGVRIGFSCSPMHQPCILGCIVEIFVNQEIYKFQKPKWLNQCGRNNIGLFFGGLQEIYGQ